MTHDARFTGQPWRFLGPTPGNAWPVLPDAAASAVLALLLQLERSQWLAPAELEAEQSRQLDLVTRHAWNTVPHYRAAWEGCYDPSQPMSRERLAALPVLSRRELQGRFLQLGASVGAGQTGLLQHDIAQQLLDEVGATGLGRRGPPLQACGPAEAAEQPVDRCAFLRAARQVHASKKQPPVLLRAAECPVEQLHQSRLERGELLRKPVQQRPSTRIALVAQPLVDP